MVFKSVKGGVPGISEIAGFLKALFALLFFCVSKQIVMLFGGLVLFWGCLNLLCSFI